MGMFDTLTCRYPLPAHSEMQERTFQTKSLNCRLDEYAIAGDGRLEIVHFRGPIGPNVAEFEGEIRFYAVEYEEGREEGSQDFGAWREWFASFRAGHLVSIKYIGE